MITYIVTEKRESYEASGGHTAKIRLERLSGVPCLVQFYEDVTIAGLNELGVQAAVFSGFTTPLQEHKVESFRGVYDVVRNWDKPIIGLCGGHQLIAELYARYNDKKLTKVRSYLMRKLKKGEPDHNAAYQPGYFKEWGFYPVEIVKRDPIFKGLPKQFMAQEFHRSEVKLLPRDFLLLASTKDVPIQAFKHKIKPIYGTQFHPERYTDFYQAGKKLLENFFRIAAIR